MAIGLVFALSGCKPEKPSATERTREARARIAAAKTSASKEAKRESEYTSSLTPAERAIVVAKVGNVDITLGYMERYLSQQPAFVRARYRTLDQKMELLNNLIRFEILAAEAERAGWSTDPDVVMAVKRAMVQKYLSDDMQRLVVASAIVDEEAATYYKNNLDTFVTPERVRVTAIVSDSEKASNAVHTELLAAIDADPSRTRVIFRDFARHRSVDKGSAWRSGDIGLFARDGFIVGDKKGLQVPEALVQPAFNLALNAVSKPIEADGKWWILQVTNRQRRSERKLEDVKREITRFLLRKKQDAARDAFIGKLRADANVTINRDVLDTLHTENIRSRKPDATAILPKAKEPVARPSRLDAEGSKVPASATKAKAAVEEPKPSSPKKVLIQPRAHLNPTARPRTLDPKANLRKSSDTPTLEEIEALNKSKAEGN
jgi:peptidyl-prolyl cis-trans isomerase C